MKKIALFFAALLAVVLTIGAIGCGDSPKGDPEEVVKDFWTAVQNSDFSTARTYLSKSQGTSTVDQLAEAGEDQLELYGEVMKTITMEITGSEQEGDSATVQVVLDMPDTEVVNNQITEMVNEQTGAPPACPMKKWKPLPRWLMTAIPDLLESAPRVQRQQTINLVWEDGSWKIDSDIFGEIDTPM